MSDEPVIFVAWPGIKNGVLMIVSPNRCRATTAHVSRARAKVGRSRPTRTSRNRRRCESAFQTFGDELERPAVVEAIIGVVTGSGRVPIEG